MHSKRHVFRDYPRPLIRCCRVLLSSLAVLLLTGSSRSAPPEVVWVHVPAGGVATWFPAGTPLRILAPEQFNARFGCGDPGI